jgi:hypothetical protein
MVRIANFLRGKLWFDGWLMLTNHQINIDAGSPSHAHSRQHLLFGLVVGGVQFGDAFYGQGANDSAQRPFPLRRVNQTFDGIGHQLRIGRAGLRQHLTHLPKVIDRHFGYLAITGLSLLISTQTGCRI